MKYRVASYEIDTQQFTFTHFGKVVAVEPKVFDVIAYLLKQRHRVVSRDELFAQVWAGREVSDTTLSNHIKSARKLFDDNGELQRTIKTIRGRGYQFIAPVEELPLLPPGTATDVIPKPAPPARIVLPASKKSKFSPVFFITLVFLTVILAALWHKGKIGYQQGERPVIVVLPFGVSSAENDKWQPFAEQMTREVIRKLRHVSALRVIPAASAFELERGVSDQEVRQKLPQVRYVIDAMVNVSGSSDIRIVATMTDLSSTTLLWEKEFEGHISATNFFSIQHNIADTVADALEIVLGVKEQQALSALPTSNLAAYEFYVSGQQQQSKLTHQSLNLAIKYYDRAIELDSKFTAAHIAKADAYRMIMSYFARPADVLPQVISSVNEALKQQPNSAEALSSLGLAYVLAFRWQDAWQILNQAKTLNSELALTELGFALYYAGMGDKVGVKRALVQANELDPLNIEVADWGHWALAMVGELDAATLWAAKQIQLHPDVGMIYSGASVSAALNHRYSHAIELAQQGVVLDPDSPYAYLALAQAYGYAGQTGKIPALLRKAESIQKYVCPYESAINYLILGDHDLAFTHFNKAVSARSNCLVFTRYDQRLNAIKDDPRYAALLTRIGLDNRSVAKYSR